MNQQPPPPPGRPLPGQQPSAAPSSLPAFPPGGGWGVSNVDQLRPRPRRSLASALLALTGWTALTFLAAYGIGWLLLTVLDALSESVDDPDGDLGAAQVAGYAALFALSMFALHWVIGALLLALFRIGEGFASWSPLVQGLLVWVVSAPVAVAVLFLGLQTAAGW